LNFNFIVYLTSIQSEFQRTIKVNQKERKKAIQEEQQDS